jgi:signal transduction histidine kinase
VLLVDALIAVLPGGSIVWATISEATGRTPPVPMDLLGSILVVVVAASLVLRRRATVVAFAVAFGGTLGYLLAGNPFGPVVQLTGLAMYSVGAWRSPRTSGLVCLAAVVGYLPLELVYGWSSTPLPTALLITAGWLVLPWLVGAGVRAYRRAQAEAAAADGREHVYAERLRIAKEVHDIVGHSLAVISMQAGVALHVLDRRPAVDRDSNSDVAAALRAVRTTSNEALGELRTALATLPEPGPRPGLDRLTALADAVGGPALAVAVVVDGEPGMVAAPVDLAGYRIAQEALTNVVRHADARRVAVRLEYGRDTVRLTVTDDGRGADTTALVGESGRGLAGMRERANAVGGTLDAGPCPGGGFEVAAVLPRAGA